MNYIFICSYLNVPCAVDTIEREGGDFRILTSNKRLAELFSELYSSDNVIKLPELFTSFGNPKMFLRDLILLPGYKKKYIDVLRESCPDKIFFYYLGWNGFESWLIKYFSNDSSIYYRPKVCLDKLKKNWNVKQYIKTIIARLLYKIPFKSMTYYRYPMIVIDNEYLRNINAISYPEMTGTNHIKKFIKERFREYSKIDVLLLVGGESNLDSNEYIRVMELLYTKLILFYKPENIGIKQHPDREGIEMSWMKQCTPITKHLPANLIMFTCSLVISYASATLYEAANINITAISLINLIKTSERHQKIRYKEYLLDNCRNKNIAFPESILDFEQALSQNIKTSQPVLSHT